MNIRTHTPVKTPEFPPISLVLYGQAKVGKSSESARVPSPLFFNLEDGLSNIAGDIIDIANPGALAAAVNELARELKAGRLAYRAAILDGLTSFVTSESVRQAIKDPRKNAKALAESLLPTLDQFFALPLIRIITLHSRTTVTETRLDGRATTFTLEEPDISPRLRTFIVGKADAIGFCHTVNNLSVVDWLPTDTPSTRIIAGNRLGLPRQTALSFQAWNATLTAPAPRQSAPVPAGAPAAAPAAADHAPRATSAGAPPARPANLRCKPGLLAAQLVALAIINKRYLGPSGQANFLADAGARGFADVTETNLKDIVTTLAAAPARPIAAAAVPAKSMEDAF